MLFCALSHKKHIWKGHFWLQGCSKQIIFYRGLNCQTSFGRNSFVKTYSEFIFKTAQIDWQIAKVVFIDSIPMPVPCLFDVDVTRTLDETRCISWVGFFFFSVHRRLSNTVYADSKIRASPLIWFWCCSLEYQSDMISALNTIVYFNIRSQIRNSPLRALIFPLMWSSSDAP